MIRRHVKNREEGRGERRRLKHQHKPQSYPTPPTILHPTNTTTHHSSLPRPITQDKKNHNKTHTFHQPCLQKTNPHEHDRPSPKERRIHNESTDPRPLKRRREPYRRGGQRLPDGSKATIQWQRRGTNNYRLITYMIRQEPRQPFFRVTPLQRTVNVQCQRAKTWAPRRISTPPPGRSD